MGWVDGIVFKLNLFPCEIDDRGGWQDLDNMAKELDFWMKDRDDQTVLAHTPNPKL